MTAPAKKHVPIRPHGFTGERHLILPADVVRRALRETLTGDLLPTAAGHFPHAGGHFVQRRRGLPDFILMLCLNGGGWCRFAGRHWRLTSGQCIIIPRGLPHAYGTTKRRPWTICWAHFRGRRAMDYLRLIGCSRSQPLLTAGNTGELARHFDAMLDLLHSGYGPANLHALTAAFAHILALLNLHRVAGRPDARGSIAQVRATAAFMRRNLARPLRLGDLARESGLSVAHFSTLFRREFGYPPRAFFVRMKVQEAGQLLATTGVPVHEIAARLGFDDAYYFSRAFKKIAGLSPRFYRLRHRPAP